MNTPSTRLIRIGGEDKVHELRDYCGQTVATIQRGWLRNGGAQWVMFAKGQQRGYKTLKAAHYAYDRMDRLSAADAARG